ncbi:MAG: Ribokinase-like protein [Benniella sp.]|nr:MAG: Ribokinase-like protein [Benniella sp.]
MTSPRVLSIQSHMVSGYCGNKAATFPLQLLGFDVDVMNTVNFSNHTGYSSWAGEKATGDQLTKLYEGLRANGLAEYTHLLTGYIGSAQSLAAVTKIIQDLQSHGNPFFVLDPVMGDNGELYVQPDVIPLYRELMKHAGAITPNQFEAETLADKKITDVKSCFEVIDILHNAGVKNVIITSVTLSPKDIAAHAVNPTTNGGQQRQEEGEEKDDMSMYCVCSSRSGDQDEKARVFAIGFPTYDGYFTGTGDLFSALLVARLFEAESSSPTDRGASGDDGLGKEPYSALAQACLKVVATMKAVVLRTFLAQKGITSGGQMDRTQASSATGVKRCELRLIQSKVDIEKPDVKDMDAIELQL